MKSPANNSSPAQPGPKPKRVLFPRDGSRMSPAKKAAIAECLGANMSLRAICRRLRTDYRSIYVVARELGDLVTTLKLDLAGYSGVGAMAALERTIENMDKIPVEKMPLCAGILIDKFLQTSQVSPQLQPGQDIKLQINGSDLFNEFRKLYEATTKLADIRELESKRAPRDKNLRLTDKSPAPTNTVADERRD